MGALLNKQASTIKGGSCDSADTGAYIVDTREGVMRQG
jgi:hypothetical protein